MATDTQDRTPNLAAPLQGTGEARHPDADPMLTRVRQLEIAQAQYRARALSQRHGLDVPVFVIMRDDGGCFTEASPEQGIGRVTDIVYGSGKRIDLMEQRRRDWQARATQIGTGTTQPASGS